MTIQVNTVTKCISDVFLITPIAIGIIIAVIVGVTILGGIKKIANVTSKLVPMMTVFYFAICIYIIAQNWEMVPKILQDIIHSAFNLKAFGIGTLSTLLIGMQKGIFSSELGLGTGSITGATADIELPAGSGLVQTFGIHFENLFIATITAIVIEMSNYKCLNILDPNGIEITLYAFQTYMGNIGTYLITIIITLFGLSSVLTIYYYCESSFKFIKSTGFFCKKKQAKPKELLILKIIMIVTIILASIASSKLLWEISDLLIGIIAIINMYAVFYLRKTVIEEYEYYKWKKKNQ